MQLRPALAKFDTVASFLQSPLLLVIRLYWGWSFAQTGWGKLTHLERTAGFFESLNIPAPKLNAIMAGGTTVGLAEWPFADVICGHADPMNFSTDVDIAGTPFSLIDRIDLLGVDGLSTPCR